MKKLPIIAILLALFSLSDLSAQTAQRMRNGAIALPNVPAPVGDYVPYKRVGNLVYINQVALVDGKILTPGVLGGKVTEEQAKQATRQTMLNVISVLNEAVDGDLDRVKQVVQITGIYNTPSGYTRHATLLNEASKLLVDIFGERGKHTRASFGASSLPVDSPVEIQAIFEVEGPAGSTSDFSTIKFEELYRKIDPKDLEANVFKLLGEQWSVVTAGGKDDYNSMIASWGGFGMIFDKPVSWLFLNAHRYTLEKIVKYNTVTLSYLGDQYKDQKLLLGSSSGRNTDKMSKVGWTAVETPAGGMTYKEAHLIIELKVESISELNPDNFATGEHRKFLIDGKNNGNGKEHHKMVMGIITNVWVRR